MPRVIVYAERENTLRQIASIDVPESADVETAAWTAWTRGRKVDAGNYRVERAGKRFGVVAETTTRAARLADPPA